MATNFFTPPSDARFALRNVNIPVCLVPDQQFSQAEIGTFDLLIEGGRIAAVEPADTLPETLGPDLDHSLVLPGLIDCHAHLDRGHVLPRAPNTAGDFLGALQATTADRETRWTPSDLRRRIEFGLTAAYAHGVVAIRTHLDSRASQAPISFPLFCELRDRWAGRITLQATSLVSIDTFLTDAGRVLADIVGESGGNLGCLTSFSSLPNVPLPPEFDTAMTNVFALASERGLDIDLHVDETSDAEVRTLIRVAQIATKVGFAGRILCGHCSSLALQNDDRIMATLDACVDAGIAVTSLPTTNMYVLGRRRDTTPRWRGVTVLHEMKARGMLTAVAGDNCRDSWYPYGDHDMLDTFVQAVRILQLDQPIGDWISVVSSVPADIMGLRESGRIRLGTPADLIVLKARNFSELIARHQSDRVVIRNGRSVGTTLPDYRILDDLMSSS